MSVPSRQVRDTSAEPPLATQLLRDEHRSILDLCRQFESTDARAREMREGVLGALLDELRLHLRIEEEIFYPDALARLPEADRGYVAQALEDHAGIEALIDGLRAMGPEGPGFRESYQEMVSNLEAHIRHEEQEILPRLERLEQLEPVRSPGAERPLFALARRMLKLREDLRGHPAFLSGRPERAA
jgi:iron-sulfur cluster repair protein YtfE (RIC family)